MRLAIVGGGVMGQALLRGALGAGVVEARSVVVCDVAEERRRTVQSEFGVAATADTAAAIGEATAVVLSVKPQDLGSVHGSLAPHALLLSVMAGVRIAALQQAFGHAAVVRAMPNTPAAIGAGMTAWTATPEVSPDQRHFARGLLSAAGEQLYVTDEHKLDMATAVSGSGPAYVFLFIEALIDGAVTVGLSRPEAEQLVLQTVLGSARYAKETGTPPSVLRGMVTSPGGTTAAGLLELERGALRASVIETVRAAYRRSVELGSTG